LVNNAYSPTHGGGQRGALEVSEEEWDTGMGLLEVSEEEWDTGMGLLVKPIFLGVKYAVPEMRKIGAGSIVNIASVHGMLMAPGKLVYEAGKSAVIGVTRQMATDFGPMGIRVNAICPGHIATERIQAAAKDNPSGARFLENQYPLRKVGRPVDVANAIVFLCSDEASFITGHALVVDGGLTVQIQEHFGVRQAYYMQEHPDTRLPS
jgi:NAD(P)-dependent dehydrogenase (short-subunit alcohol dehydrogenase family)